ncbi:TIGR01777 family oxidoreductase [Akkermansiaceae bacterium]|nr:TIGR01777 family oxidoreductase [Akkermansiaceae bacterium]
MMKKLVIAGANGFLGLYLSRWFLDRGWEVLGLSRSGGVTEGVTDLRWDGRTLGDWAESLDGAEVLVNLAGRSVNCRYHEENRKLILDSRVESTAILGEAIQACEKPPKLWMNSSTATIYRHAEDGPQSELKGEVGTGFSVGIAKAWEEAFFQARVPGEVRKVAMRTAMVIANEAGTVYDYLFKLSQLGLGGKMASGRQRVSWIHVEDFCRATEWMIQNTQAEGIYNVVAPEAETNAETMRLFREIAGRSFGLPASRWMLEIGAFVMRTETEMVTKSRWVIPERLEGAGFEFRWRDLKSALADLSHRSGYDALRER